MAQFTIGNLADSLPRLTLKRSWSIGSVVAISAAIIVSIMAFVLGQPGASQMVLLGTIATLFILTILHARFISFAQGQSRQTTELLCHKELEFQSVFENALDSILVLDGRGVCQNANPSAGTFFGLHRDRIIGRPVRRFYSDKNEFDAMWNQLHVNGESEGQVSLLRSDGATIFAEFNATARFLPNRHLMILRDITSRHRAQQAVNQSLMAARSSWQEAETLRKASLALTEDLRMNSVLDALLRTLGEFVPFERAQLFLLETDTRLFLAHEVTQSTKQLPDPGLPETLEVADLPIIKRVLTSPEGILAEDMHTELGHLGERLSIRSWIGVPIVSSDEVLGLLSLTDSNPSRFSANHLALTRSLAAPAAVAVRNARLYERTEIYGAELEQRVAETQQIERESQGSEERNRESSGRFESIFRSAPVALSVSSLSDGRFLEINDTFRRNFGITQEQRENGIGSELELWHDLRERAKIIERLGRGAKVRGAVARFRQQSGLYREIMYSAAIIDVEGQPRLLIAAEEPIEPFV